MASEFPDIHRYDGQCRDHNFKPPKVLSESERRSKLEAFLANESLLLSAKAKEAAKVVIDGIGTSANSESSNALVADELFCEIVDLVPNDPSDMQVLEEQFLDMHTGFCPSGRCTRLYQVYAAYAAPK